MTRHNSSKNQLSDEIETMKDEVSEMLEEMRTGYPGVYHIILDERNVYLTAMLQATVRQPQKITPEIDPKGQVPPVVVAIVGIGHQAGIVELFDRSKFHRLLRKIDFVSIE